MVNGQMTIFDLMLPEQKPLDAYTEDEMVQVVGNAVGIPFVFKDSLFGWEYSKGKVKYDIRFGNYSVGKKDRFIHVGWEDRRNGYSGCGCPVDSIDSAIQFFKRKISEVENG